MRFVQIAAAQVILFRDRRNLCIPQQEKVQIMNGFWIITYLQS